MQIADLSHFPTISLFLSSELVVIPLVQLGELIILLLET